MTLKTPNIAEPIPGFDGIGDSWHTLVRKNWEAIVDARKASLAAPTASKVVPETVFGRAVLHELQELAIDVMNKTAQACDEHVARCNNDVVMLRGATEALLAQYLDRAMKAEAELAARAPAEAPDCKAFYCPNRAELL
jgi:hypothetical protein